MDAALLIDATQALGIVQEDFASIAEEAAAALDSAASQIQPVAPGLVPEIASTAEPAILELDTSGQQAPQPDQDLATIADDATKTLNSVVAQQQVQPLGTAQETAPTIAEQATAALNSLAAQQRPARRLLSA